MYRYYRERDFNPTYANLEDTERFKAYFRERSGVFQEKLYLPIRLFKNAEVLEFGPAGGENALILAMWGAKLHLVEPVESFHPTIRNYFSQYKQSHRLKLLSPLTFSDFASDKRFDVVLAEGFIHTTGPAREWTSRLVEFSSDHGLIIFNISELAGYLIEIFQTRLCRVASGRHNLDELETARIILGPKWQQISHSRSFRSWVDDLVNNPFVDYPYLNHCGDVIQLMHQQGFDLYSSWPSLRPPSDVRWIRCEMSREEKLEELQAVALQLVPSMILGEPVPIRQPENTTLLQELVSVLREELKSISDMTKDASDDDRARVLEAHENTVGVLRNVVEDYPSSRLSRLMQEMHQSVESCFEPPDRIAEFFGSGTVLGSTWGSPNQYLVFQRADTWL